MEESSVKVYSINKEFIRKFDSDLDNLRINIINFLI